MKIGIRNDGTQMTQILRTTADFIFGSFAEKKESANIRKIRVIRVPSHH